MRRVLLLGRRRCIARFIVPHHRISCHFSSNPKEEKAHVVLGVGRTCTKDELREAYYLKAKACHPDTNRYDPEAKENFTRLSKAYQELLTDILEREASGEKISTNIGEYFTCPTLGHHKSTNLECQIENCPFCAMFGSAGGGSYTEPGLDPAAPKNRPQRKSDKTSILGKKLPPVTPLFRR
ncbi:hypothetical protein AAMO2058_001720800 [Amorphochlora amoebiformis]